MISRTYSRWERFYQLDALKSVPFVTNGQVVQQVMEDGRKKGRPSNAINDSIFLGLSWGIYRGRGITQTKIEVVKTGAAANGVATALLSAPSVGDLYVYKGVDYSGSLMTSTSSNATPTGASDYDLGDDGRTIIVDDQNANTDIFVVYNYSPTVLQQRFLYEGGGDLYPGNNAPEAFGQVGVITEGIVYTDQFDPSVNWLNVTDATQIKGAANGKLTIGGTGCLCRGLKIHAVPTADNPFLGVTLGYSI